MEFKEQLGGTQGDSIPRGMELGPREASSQEKDSLLMKSQGIGTLYVSQSLMIANSAFIGPTAPGDVGSWQIENKVSSALNQIFLKA
ncbi:hypothetical protein HAX54_044490 [Datura stramonium]|uniref:Uncharacterized protein n=1 Tax=Datura stramonium TaxID=4076 RepID=A0ABS8WGE9_DATST|nr:hypothetical protein [Datura stramonium]